jgi:putative FmdB family regulatory protein
MPTYDYRCDGCEHAFEAFQSITAKPLRKCPECGKSRLRRLIGTGAALLFKGDGFYITDYRSEKYKEAAKADAPATTDAKPTDASAKATTAQSPQTPTAAKEKAEPAKPTGKRGKSQRKPS